ncbi:integrase catalytic domain-containing protein [Trichonephila inaurata madagascariensis]|uniref:Integrase catalytic domain-containing protein n=1 Tax=Trichonephila inaurata madagascariensis TaxID=2747483 RepID=A0A8X7C9A6_9ARAC|nr:integrase catalytic domain-containing protein [Trichonephila inaurata madagascariensis]
MFRQIKDLIGRYRWQRILWRDNPKELVKEYRLTTVSRPQLTLSLLRQSFEVYVDGRSVVRYTLKRCLMCFKMNLRSSSQLMGDLPPIRFQQKFVHSRAVHLELVSDLSTAAFLAALRRFIARRSCPSKIISDNGSNFKGASSHLKARGVVSARRSTKTFFLSRELSGLSFTPYTPHFGGLWESAIKLNNYS